MKGMDRFHPNGKESAKMRQILNFTATGTPTIILQLFAKRLSYLLLLIGLFVVNLMYIVGQSVLEQFG